MGWDYMYAEVWSQRGPLSIYRKTRKRKWRIGEIILTQKCRSCRRRTSADAISPTRTVLETEQYREVSDVCQRHETTHGVVNRRWPVARGQTSLDMAGDVTFRTGVL
jgi:hypothetical protein